MYLCCLRAGERRCRDACLFRMSIALLLYVDKSIRIEKLKFATSRTLFYRFGSLAWNVELLVESTGQSYIF